MIGTRSPCFEQPSQLGITSHEWGAAKLGTFGGGGGYCLGELPRSLLSDAVGQRRSLQGWLGSQTSQACAVMFVPL